MGVPYAGREGYSWVPHETGKSNGEGRYPQRDPVTWSR